jgi:hypothetical protein
MNLEEETAMKNDMADLLSRFNRNSGASTASIEGVSKDLGSSLPGDYASFLEICNGGEGMLGRHYLMLWKVDEIAHLNEAYQVSEYAPGLLFFGSNGGGEAFAFDTRQTPWSVVKVPFVGMNLEHVIQIAGSFGSFMQHLADE